MSAKPTHSVERDRLLAVLVGSLRGFAATTVPHVKRQVLPFATRSTSE